MAKKKVSETAVKIRKLLASDKIIIGTEKTIKELRKGKLSKIFISATCSQKTVADLEKYAGLAGVEIQKLKLPSDEIGVICKKPFSISVLGVLKGK
ncbi:ribosomal L7Ae/L30e/S12e/Gadd45 family protein [Candidatus Woesearchaeota archaeon]|nr:ribosomal L7Ae/L30e/S12e/Gadd45 family protein [Candidatus Woesearchaeota archaeon]MBW2978839.1 ribosomal L7Ae/L30e/S12e/Gadd45 family protein [Candidatus Woesearchaeota archaeon]